MEMNIAIDGPSGSGKSSVSKLLSEKLGYVHIDTGAMYRAVAYACLKNNIDTNNEADIVSLIDSIKLSFNSNNQIMIDDVVLQNEIRKDNISMLASNISKFPNVRFRLVQLQRAMAKSKGFILDGRDIGSVVLKDAEVKVYLDASSDVRAQRRVLQNQALHIDGDYETIKKSIEERDYQDKNRTTSPLVIVPDALYIDATYLTLDEVVDKIMHVVERRLHHD